MICIRSPLPRFTIICGIIVGLLYTVIGHTKEDDILTRSWREVGTRFYDKSMNLYDWNGVLITYQEKLSSHQIVGNSPLEAASNMLGLLESSHLQIFPSSDQELSSTKYSQFSIIAPETRSTFGVTLSFKATSKLPIVTSIANNSPLLKFGVGIGSRLLITIETPEHGTPLLNAYTVSRNGADRSFQIPAYLVDPDNDEPSISRGPNQYTLNRLSVPAIRTLAGERTPAQSKETSVIYKPLGVTTTLGRSASVPTVIAVEGGSAAAAAGVRIGANLVSLNSNSDGKSILVLGTKTGTNIVLTHRTVPMNIDSFSSMKNAITIGQCRVISFNTFNDAAYNWIIRNIGTPAIGGLILDLRTNGGGDAIVMSKIIGLFVEEHTFIGTAQGRSNSKEIYSAKFARPNTTSPMRLLIGPGTGSAAEIMAATFKSAGRARLFGAVTAGEVLEARVFPLSKEYNIQIPVSSFLDRDHRPLEGVGVSPHVFSEASETDVRRGVDRTLASALSDAHCEIGADHSKGLRHG